MAAGEQLEQYSVSARSEERGPQTQTVSSSSGTGPQAVPAAYPALMHSSRHFTPPSVPATLPVQQCRRHLDCARGQGRQQLIAPIEIIGDGSPSCPTKEKSQREPCWHRARRGVACGQDFPELCCAARRSSIPICIASRGCAVNNHWQAFCAQCSSQESIELAQHCIVSKIHIRSAIVKKNLDRSSMG